MKTKLKTKKRTYPDKLPILMQSKDNNTVVLVTHIKDGSMTGTCIHSDRGDCSHVGEWSDGWDIDLFVVCEGSVKLKN